MAAVSVITSDSHLTSSELKKLILNELKVPTIFRGFITSNWEYPLTWSPQFISQKLNDVCTKFKVCPKTDSFEYKKLFSDSDVVFETQCQYIEADFSQFSEWISSDQDETKSTKRLRLETDILRPNPFLSISRSQYWVYADYKYMNELCCNHQTLVEAIDWNVFGFESRNGNQSTLWIGSEGACTPCHYDTYGCNLVAQLWGTKEWTLYSPSDNDMLYPTRIPYEESSVFSSVNIKSPNATKHSRFFNATPYKITLSPGDVLFVPYHWWHYVECLEPAVSVNTWLELPQDNEERLKEAIVRTLVSAMVTPDFDTTLVNPNEVILPLEDNIELVKITLGSVQGKEQPSLPVIDLINAVSCDKVINTIISELKVKTF